MTSPVTRGLNRAFLSLGSNLNPEQNLRAAVERLGAFGQVEAVSSVWQTSPLGRADQPDYLNAAVLLATPLSALALRNEAIPALERALGRVRTSDKNASRTIDVDIMLFNHDVIRLGTRRIPDPEILERPFVAITLAEIAPDYVHPETGQTLREIAARFDPETVQICRSERIQLRRPIPINSEG
jgi:2-amino-4-hydroxy-6-hydroxymethyldihydropteridine diphosphokinase